MLILIFEGMTVNKREHKFEQLSFELMELSNISLKFKNFSRKGQKMAEIAREFLSIV